ncbi:biotin carboxylase N-terminal domain-containing protein [Marivivens donghaensis]|jgi:3-methylcrotonyl-CoA carboxylase alpha subunit|uniref:acetyl/propionyl/methylcrotonyl-CoA carboxylase subunit alpha n=1 Tax=Marivivens donghaensis TaxID=1699413 RepID=UPI003F6984A2
MFGKILIANRGEIACRVIRTARALGVKTVAVYSDADANAMHVAMADEAVRLGPAPVADSYLRGDLIIEAALKTGAQGIHPGYGFLSENPDFVEAVEKAGLTFIGPSASSIRAMGLKDAAKALMEKANVPVVPGYHGADQSPEFLAQKAGEIGYPVLIKAVAGGGGKGMRRVDDAAKFAEALASAQAEARTAFGNADVLIEKYILSPRHIEVQVFGDGTSAVHLFERDCSLQRRHQKVIEEAPAPGMTPDLRDRMGAAAVKAAEAISYSGAGTVEFIVDGTTMDFWFMEMNTRLQVEHPVTEAITGVDLVEWQLRVASGEPLPMAQSDLTITGHAFEARLYAEDVPAGFLPATGRIAHLQFADGVRADSGVRAGDTITPWYDPMIAKLIVHGPDRDTALRELARACAQTEVAGTVTNLGFLGALARHEGFAAGNVDTGLIERDLDALTRRAAPTAETIALSALIAMRLDANPAPQTGFTLWVPVPQIITLLVKGEEIVVNVTTFSADRFEVAVGDTIVAVRRSSGGLRLNDQAAPNYVKHGDSITVFANPVVEITIPDPLDRGGAEAASDAILSPMPGLLRAMEVTAGQTVKAGDRLAVLEAMKMEHILRAPRDGVIATVGATAGSQVEAGALLIALEEEVA